MCHGARPSPTAAAFLTALADPARGPIPGVRVAVVVAHPDDETIGVGGQLPRLARPILVHVTDGAPRDLADAHALGFDSWQAYAAARRRELEAAVALAGVPADRLSALGVPDQGAIRRVPAITEALARLFRAHRIELVLTHPYEGGHVDHDAVALAVHAACASLGRAGGSPPGIVDMAFYHAGPGGLVTQRFPAEPPTPEIAVELDQTVRALKRRMIGAHRTQARVLAPFSVDVERFRVAPAYDFTRPANAGRVHYPAITPSITAGRWCALAAAALAELGLCA